MIIEELVKNVKTAQKPSIHLTDLTFSVEIANIYVKLALSACKLDYLTGN